MLVPDVGQPEPCDWCGRPGTIRQHLYWRDGEVVCRNPSVCDVCEFFRSLPSDVVDAIYDCGLDYHGQFELAFERELEAKWRQKVACGEREPLAENEQIGMAVEVIPDR